MHFHLVGKRTVAIVPCATRLGVLDHMDGDKGFSTDTPCATDDRGFGQDRAIIRPSKVFWTFPNGMGDTLLFRSPLPRIRRVGAIEHPSPTVCQALGSMLATFPELAKCYISLELKYSCYS